jgi:hypothetical protein
MCINYADLFVVFSFIKQGTGTGTFMHQTLSFVGITFRATGRFPQIVSLLILTKFISGF